MLPLRLQVEQEPERESKRVKKACMGKALCDAPGPGAWLKGKQQQTGKASALHTRYTEKKTMCIWIHNCLCHAHYQFFSIKRFCSPMVSIALRTQRGQYTLSSVDTYSAFFCLFAQGLIVYLCVRVNVAGHL